MLRVVRAPNPSPMTLDGTRTYLVGRARIAVIDPGPALPAHLDAVSAAIGDGAVASVLLTHGHADHAAGARTLAVRHGAAVRRWSDGSLAMGDVIETDAGELGVLHTPGHTPDHVAFDWAEESAIFCGDLMMGGLTTALVAPPEGDLAAYLDSLALLESRGPATIYPAHGEPFDAPPEALRRYREHRHARLSQVIAGLEDTAISTDSLAERIYGEQVEPALRPAAVEALRAYLGYLVSKGTVINLKPDLWIRADRAD